MRRLAFLAIGGLASLLGVGSGLLLDRAIINTANDRWTPERNGWRSFQPPPTVGVLPGVVRRAVDTIHGVAAPDPAGTSVFETQIDSDRRTLSGASRYVLHFARDQTPPVNAFWSIDVMATDGPARANAGRTIVSSRMLDLVRNPDGSIDIEIAASPPPSANVNWLAAPEGVFQVNLRTYDPASAIRDGRWSPPPIERRESTA
jgi:hypothetical protein